VSRRQIGLLWAGAFTFYLSFLLLLSALPIFARRLGASDAAVGVVMAAFAVTSLLLRPVTGWGVDRYGRRPFMVAGALLFALASIAYVVTAGTIGLVLVRLVHGCGMGLYPTAASTMVADLTPPDRRGEILGFYGAAGSVALAVGPIAGIALMERTGFGPLFWIAGAVATVALVISLGLGETLARARLAPFTVADMLSAAALLPGAIILCLMFTYGALIAFVPLHADTQGINAGVFFLVFAITITLARVPAGRLSDRLGRPPLAAAGLLFAAAALLVLAFSESALSLALAGAIYGVAYGTAQPALIAWSVDLAPEGERGRTMGTFYTALELGIAVGAVSAGLAVARWGIVRTFLATAAVAAAGATLTLAGRRR
jgi:MFS family permease